MLGIRSAEPIQRLVGLADVFQFLGQRVAEQQPAAPIARFGMGAGEPLDVVPRRRVLAQTGEQVVRARIARRQRDQGLERSIGLIGPTEEIERDRLVVAVFGVAGLQPHRFGEMAQRCRVIAKPGIDAAHRIATQRIGGRGMLGISQGCCGIAIAAHQREQLGQLRAIFALRIERHRAAEVLNASLNAAGARFGHAQQEVAFGIARIFSHHGCGEALRRIKIASGQRAARGAGLSWADGVHAVAVAPAVSPSVFADCLAAR